MKTATQSSIPDTTPERSSLPDTLTQEHEEAFAAIGEVFREFYRKLSEKHQLAPAEIIDLYAIGSVVAPTAHATLVREIAEHQRGSFADLVPIAKQYRWNFAGLSSNLGKINIVKYEESVRPQLLRIQEIMASSGGAFHDLPAELLLSHPTEVLDCYERYGKYAPDVFALFEGATLEVEPMYRKPLTELTALGRGEGHPLRSLDTKVLSCCPDALVEYARAAKGDLRAVLADIPADMFIEDPASFIELAKRYEEATPGVLFFAHENLFAIEAELRGRLKQVLDLIKEEKTGVDCSSVAFWSEPWMLRDHQELMLALIKGSGAGCVDVIRRIRDIPELVTCAPEFTLRCVERRGSCAAETLNVPRALLRDNSKLLQDILAFIPGTYEYVIPFIPVGLATRHPNDVLDNIRRYGTGAGAVFHVFKEDALEAFAEFQAFIHQVTEAYGDEAFHYLMEAEPEEWDQGRNLGQELEEFSSTSNGDVRQRVRASGLSEIARQSREQFNIHYFDRFLSHPRGEELLARNLANLDPRIGPERPIILYGMGKSDLGRAFRQGLPDLLCELSERSRLLFFEMGHMDDLAVQVIRAGSLFGLTPGGEPLRPLHAVFTLAHSNGGGSQLNQRSVLLMDSQETQRVLLPHGWLSVKHDSEIAELGRWIERGGYLGFLGCSPGQRIDGYDSLVDVAAREVPHAHVLGSTDLVSSASNHPGHWISTDEGGRVADIWMNNKGRPVLWYKPRTPVESL